MTAKTPPRPDGELLSVRVQPRSGRNQVVGWQGEALRVRVTAAPQAGEAGHFFGAQPLIFCRHIGFRLLQPVSVHGASHIKCPPESVLRCFYDLQIRASLRGILGCHSALHSMDEIGTEIRGRNNTIQGTYAERTVHAVYPVKFAGHFA